MTSYLTAVYGKGNVMSSSRPRGMSEVSAGITRAPWAAMDDAGIVSVDGVAELFGMSKQQLAETVGLDPQTLYKANRATAQRTQSRLREMLEIIARVSDWAGGQRRAMAWYRAQPIAAFGGRTAEALVKDGNAAALRDYLDHLAQGGFA
jgi:hypothetical protein